MTARRRRSFVYREPSEVGAVSAQAPTRTPRLAAVVQLYLADLKTRTVSRHFKQVQSALEKTLDVLGDIKVHELQPLELVRIRTTVSSQGASNRTANLVVTRMQATLRWAVESGLVDASPIERIKRLPEKGANRTYRRRALSEAEIVHVLATTERDDEHCASLAADVRIPQAPLFLAFLETGARYGELVCVTWGDLDAEKGLLRLRAETTKSSKERQLPVRREFVEVLLELQRVHTERLGREPALDERIFLTPEGADWPWHSANLMRIFDRVLEAAGIPKRDGNGSKLDIHALRHSYGTRLARNNVSLTQVQRLMGHSDPKLTAAVYTHLEVEDLRGAVETLGKAQ